jgi:hypothetical protein
MEFGIRDIYDADDRPRADDESLEQADDPTVKPKRGRKSSKPGYGKRQARKVDPRPADVAAESDY